MGFCDIVNIGKNIRIIMEEIEQIKAELVSAKEKVGNVAGDVSKLLEMITSLQDQLANAGLSEEAKAALAEVAGLATEINSQLAEVDAKVE